MVTGDGVAERGAKEDVGREMRKRGYAREAYGGSEAIGEPGNPAVMAITGGDHCGYRKGSCGVTRWE